MSLPVQVGPAQSLASRTERVLRAPRQRGVWSVDSGSAGCAVTPHGGGQKPAMFALPTKPQARIYALESRMAEPLDHNLGNRC